MAAISRTLTFVYAAPFKGAGTAFLRAIQLAELAARRIGTVRTRELSELPEGLRDEVLIFNKSCLHQRFLETTLQRLAVVRAGNACLADPVDLAISEQALERFDGVVAASAVQADYLASRLRKPVYLVHHHVDLRLAPALRECGALRAAYFGEIENTLHAETLNDLVDFFLVDTTNAGAIPWAAHLPYYNLHYCLRRNRSDAAFKPATKLFLAAFLGAPVVIERANEEVRRLLPADYPYFTASAEQDEARKILRRAAETFGKDEWRYAKTSMTEIDCYRPERVLDSIEALMRAFMS